MKLMAPFLIGGALALVLNFPMKFIEDRLPVTGKGKRPLALGAVLSIAGALAVILLSLIIPQLTASVSQLAHALPVLWDSLRIRLEEWGRRFPAFQPMFAGLADSDFSNLMQQGIPLFLDGFFSVDTTVGVAADMLSGIVNLGIGVVLAAYLLARKEQLGYQVKLLCAAWLPDGVSCWLNDLLSLCGETFGAFLSGQCLEACILGGIFALFMAVGRFPSVALISIVIGVTALIPVFGSFIGCFFGVFVIMATEPDKVIWFMVLFICLQQLEGMCIYPRVVGSKVGLPPLWVLIAVTLGGRLFGILGMLALIPVFSVFYGIIKKKTMERIQKKHL